MVAGICLSRRRSRGTMMGNSNQNFRPFRWLSHAALLCTLCLALSQRALGSSVVLRWNPSTDRTVVGYFVYIGRASGGYSVRFDAVIHSGTTSSNLLHGRTY